MKIFSLLKIFFFCLFIQTSLAFENEITVELDKFLHFIKNVSDDSFTQPKLNVIDEVYIRRYIDLDLSDIEERKMSLLADIFPERPRNDTDYVHDEENRKIFRKLELPENHTSYYNGYLVNVNGTWKVSKYE